MQISKYLYKIKIGEAINFDNFSKQLLQHGYNEKTILTIFQTKKLSRSHYSIKILDQRQFSQLQATLPERIIIDRASAAQAGNSHKHSVSQAMIILWSTQSQHPVVILNNIYYINSPVTLSKRLLIIETQEDFIQKQPMLNFLQQQFLTLIMKILISHLAR